MILKNENTSPIDTIDEGVYGETQKLEQKD